MAPGDDDDRRSSWPGKPLVPRDPSKTSDPPRVTPLAPDVSVRRSSVRPPPPTTTTRPPRRPSTHPPSLRPTRPPSIQAPDLLASARRLSLLDFDLVNAAQRIVDGALGLVLGDHFVVITDRNQDAFARTLADAAVGIGATAELIDLDELGSRPHRSVPHQLETAVARAQGGVYLASYVDGEAPLLDGVARIVRERSLRFGSMVGSSRRGVLAGFAADTHRIADTSRAIRLRLRADSVLTLRTHAGSDLTVHLTAAHRWIERVGKVRPARFDSLPLAQLLTAPAKVSGIFVADASVGIEADPEGGHAIRNPVRFEIESGVLRAARSRDALLERRVGMALRREHQLDAVGLIVLGTNVSLDGPTGEIVLDQTAPGLHLSFGSSLPELTGAPAGANAHFLASCAHADVDLDGTPLLRSGRFLPSFP